jgi:hypothetical protein
MKKLLLLLSLAVFGCTSLTPNQRAFLSSAETIASVAATAAATYYGGPAAGQLASAGLSALGSVLQGYVGTTVPKAIIENSPGIAGVGAAVAAVLPPQPVSQKTVDTVNKAAAIAATLKAANIIPLVPPTPSPAP